MRLGSQYPTLLSLPVDRRGSAGQEVADVAALAGLVLDDWQAWVVDNATAEQADGRWSAFEVGIEVGRQNGKGSILEARQLAGLTILHDRLQVHTAHEFKTCFEHFLRMVNLVESNPDIDRQVVRIRRGAGEQAIEMRGGERLRFLARSGGSGRGLTGDVVYLDEAFALTPSMMGALLPTLSARPNPQVWYTSSAPMASSTVQHGVRARAVAGGSARLFYAAWCNDPDVDLEDRDAWARANPALGIRISEEFIEAELDAMRATPDEFRRERLGVPEMSLEAAPTAVPFEVWSSLNDPDSRIVSHRSWALAVSPDRRWASLGLAGRDADGRLHVEWIAHEAGTAWIVEKVASASYVADRLPLRIHKQGPEAAFITPLRERGIEVLEVSSAEVAQATGQLIDAATSGGLAHLGQKSLDRALRGAVLRLSADGASMWSQRASEVEITPLVAVTVAAGGVPAAGPADSVYGEERGMLVLG